MKHKTVLFVFTAIITIITMFFACDTKPTEPVRDNPFDPNNSVSGGDPFQLTAKIAGGGITLGWTIPDIKDTQSFKIYRSETENNGYAELAVSTDKQTQYVDKNIENGHSYWYRVTAINSENKETNISNTAGVNINTEPVLVINGGAEYTANREVTLTILAATAKQMMLANDADFSGAAWENYATSKTWTLLTGEGQKTVYMKVKYDSTESEVVQEGIFPREVSNYSLKISDSDTSNTLDVTLNIHAEYAEKMMISNDNSFIGAVWEDYAETQSWHLDFLKITDSKVKVYMKFKNDFEIETSVINDEIVLSIVSGIKINNNDAYTSKRAVTLNIFSENANQMMISGSSDFSGANWEDYAETKNWILPTGSGPFTVYAKFKNSSGLISKIYSDDISPNSVSNISLNINNADSTSTLDIILNINADHATKMKISNNADFSDAIWEDYNNTKPWHLDFSKVVDSKAKVYAIFKNDFETESIIFNDEIVLSIVSGIKINKNDAYTAKRAVTLNIFSENANQMMISENSGFSGANWEDYAETKKWILPSGSGPFTIYAKFKNSSGLISKIYSDDISPQPINPSITIADGSQYTASRDVLLTLSATGSNLQMKLSEDSTFTSIAWQAFSATPNFQLSTGDGQKTVYAIFKNDFEIITIVVMDNILPQQINPSITIANGSQYTASRDVLLSLSATGSNLQMKLSEDSTFTSIAWQAFSSSANFQLSTGEGQKTVYAIFKNDFDIESQTMNDDIVMDTTPPNIVLTVTPDSGITNETDFQFDPTGSSDNLSPALDLRVRYDYENDGNYDTEWEALQVRSKKWEVGGGDKTIKMQIKDGAGWEVETTKTIFVNTRPQVSFTVTIDNSNYKLYHFDASTSTDYEDGKNLEYRWDFNGDGSWDTNWLMQDTISYEYANDGDYNAKLSVHDQQSLTKEQVIQVSVVPTMTDIDGNVYRIVKIGDQWWMAENLKVTKYRNGDNIPNVTNSSTWVGLTTGARCTYNNDNGNIATYGLLYNWYAVDDSRNIAPAGWHVPTDAEYTTLENYLIANGYNWDGTTTGNKIGKSLASKTGWSSSFVAGDVGNNMSTNNASGFSALPGGYRVCSSGTFGSIGTIGYWWSATEYSSANAWNRYLYYNYSDFSGASRSKQYGFSVRLIRD